jgi:cell division protein FtsQ
MWQDIKALNAISAVMLGLALMMIATAGARWIALRPMFNLHQVRVEAASDQPEGLRRVNALTVRSTALPRIKGNFFTVNLESVKSAFEAVPWVHRVTVRRAWPDRLVVSLDEFTPLGTWGDDGKLLSTSGEVFTANLDEAEEDGALLKFSGPDGSESDVHDRLADFRQWFLPMGVHPVGIQLSERYAWTVALDNGVQVALGREQTPTTLQDRVKRLVQIYPELASRWQNRIVSVDLRYQNGLALKASDPPEQAGKPKNSRKS